LSVLIGHRLIDESEEAPRLRLATQLGNFTMFQDFNFQMLLKHLSRSIQMESLNIKAGLESDLGLAQTFS